MGDLTFLMNSDPSGASNQFYSLAKQYFVAAGVTVIDAPAGGQTLEGVFTRLKTETKEQKTINLVSHANGFAAMECPGDGRRPAARSPHDDGGRPPGRAGGQVARATGTSGDHGEHPDRDLRVRRGAVAALHDDALRSVR